MKPWLRFLCLSAAILASCDAGPKSSSGFRLPEGDVQAGQACFVQLGCVRCHSVAGVTFEPAVSEREVNVPLGGKVYKVRTYGELVTAIINPSYELAPGQDPETVSHEGQSLMADHNDEMSVKQLIDLVAFIQSKYIEYLPHDYDPYFP